MMEANPNERQIAITRHPPLFPASAIGTVPESSYVGLVDRHFRSAGPGPANVGPLGQQHPDGDLLGDRAADRRV